MLKKTIPNENRSRLFPTKKNKKLKIVLLFVIQNNITNIVCVGSCQILEHFYGAKKVLSTLIGKLRAGKPNVTFHQNVCKKRF